jgi:hypothetical protein
MLLKLRGTFKVRVFEGTDWRITAPASVGEPISSSSSIAAAAAAAVTSGGFISGSKEKEKEKEKGVRFKKDDLLSDLMAPPQKPSFSAATGPSRSTQSTAAALSAAAARAPHQQPQPAIKRSSRPLFEV